MNNNLKNFLDSQIININNEISEFDNIILPHIEDEKTISEIIGDEAVQLLIEKTYYANMNTGLTGENFQFGGIIDDNDHFVEHEKSRNLVIESYKLTEKSKLQYKQCISKHKRRNSSCRFEIK